MSEAPKSEFSYPMEVATIERLLPHRYPILLVDRVERLEGNRIWAVKLVSSNEPILQGHFPGDPLMPGVLLVEALAQVSGIYALVTDPSLRRRPLFLASIERARFRRPVRPGDRVEMEVEMTRRHPPFLRFRGVARVGGQVAAEAEFMAAVQGAPREEKGGA